VLPPANEILSFAAENTAFYIEIYGPSLCHRAYFVVCGRPSASKTNACAPRVVVIVALETGAGEKLLENEKKI
jgi:hypothetical protein